MSIDVEATLTNTNAVKKFKLPDGDYNALLIKLAQEFNDGSIALHGKIAFGKQAVVGASSWAASKQTFKTESEADTDTWFYSVTGPMRLLVTVATPAVPTKTSNPDFARGVMATATVLFAELYGDRAPYTAPPIVPTLRDFSVNRLLSPAGKHYSIAMTTRLAPQLEGVFLQWTGCVDVSKCQTATCKEAMAYMTQTGIDDPKMQLHRLLLYACLSADAQTYVYADPDATVTRAAWVFVAEQRFNDNYNTRARQAVEKRQTDLEAGVPPSISGIEMWFRGHTWAVDVDQQLMDALRTTPDTESDRAAAIMRCINTGRDTIIRAIATQPRMPSAWKPGHVFSSPATTRADEEVGCRTSDNVFYNETRCTNFLPNEYRNEWYECEYQSLPYFLATNNQWELLLATVQSESFRHASLWDRRGNHLLTCPAFYSDPPELQRVLQRVRTPTTAVDVAVLASAIASSSAPLPVVRLLYAWTTPDLQLQWVGALYAANKDTVIANLATPSALWYLAVTQELQDMHTERATRLLARIAAD